MLPIEALQERIEQSELGKAWINNPLLNQDVWSLKELGYSEEELRIGSKKNIYFKEFSLPWLKVLSKLTALAIVREGHSSNSVRYKVLCLRQFDEFLQASGYHQPELITNSLVQRFIAHTNSAVRQGTIAYVSKLWAEEQWLKLPYIPRRYQKKPPKVETIPEEVLHQIYENFDQFPPPLERVFRLQIALGCRIGEMLRMPRQCLKKEGERWFLLRWVQKRKHWRFFQVHFAVVELVREQQKFLNKQLGVKSDFDKLFCKLSCSTEDGVKGLGKKGKTRFDVEPIYVPKFFTSNTVGRWLREFSIQANLKDKHGKRFKLTSHMFRRTKASLMAYCDAEDEYIAAVLGHDSLEEQQKWIAQVFGKDYSYLFCHFRAIKQASYPSFPNIKPLPQPPKTNASVNPMVRIIRMLIERENILDANGQKPHFIGKITRSSRLQEVRAKHGMEAAQLYADHKSSNTTFQHYAPPTREQIAKVDLPFQELLLNPDNKFLPWQSLPESLLKNPTAHELDLEIAPRLVVYGHCALNPKTPCPVNLFPKCYGCSSFRTSTAKLHLYERQYEGEQQRLTEADNSGAELAFEEAKATIEAMDKWLPELRRLANG